MKKCILLLSNTFYNNSKELCKSMLLVNTKTVLTNQEKQFVTENKQEKIQSKPLKEQLKDTLTEELYNYHRLDNRKDGSKLFGIQYPPFVKEGNPEEVKVFLGNLIDHVVNQLSVSYIPAPTEPEARKQFRQVIAEKALPEIRMHVRKEFDATVNKMQNTAIKLFVTSALEKAQPEFFIAPSSSTGKHHPADEINEGGLLLHTIRNVATGRFLAKYFHVKPKQEDEIVAALILHDIQKGGIPWKKTSKPGDAPYSGYDPAHGPIAAKWLSQFEGDCKTVCKDIERDVEHHMAQWNEPTQTPPETIEEQIVSYADYIASIDNIYVNWRTI